MKVLTVPVLFLSCSCADGGPQTCGGCSCSGYSSGAKHPAVQIHSRSAQPSAAHQLTASGLHAAGQPSTCLKFNIPLLQIPRVLL